MIFLKGRLRRMHSDFISLASVCSKSNLKKIAFFLYGLKVEGKSSSVGQDCPFMFIIFFLADCDPEIFSAN